VNSYPANWPDIRQQQLDHDGNRCRGCGITAKHLSDLGWAPLQVHHINEGPPHFAGPYHREVVGENLLTLCPDCHDGITDSVRRQRYRLSPNKKVELSVSEEQQGQSIRESQRRPDVQITVQDDQPAPGRPPAARRIDISLFS